MRTTVEITAEQHRRLIDLAADRGDRGFSPIVREAIDCYLRDRSRDDIESALALGASISGTEADEMRKVIAESRAMWRS